MKCPKWCKVFWRTFQGLAPLFYQMNAAPPMEKYLEFPNKL